MTGTDTRLGRAGFSSKEEAIEDAETTMAGLMVAILRKESLLDVSVKWGWVYPVDYGRKLAREDATITFVEAVTVNGSRFANSE